MTLPDSPLTAAAEAVLEMLQAPEGRLEVAIGAARILMLDLGHALEAEWLSKELEGYFSSTKQIRLGDILDPGPGGDELRKRIAQYRGQIGHFTVLGPDGERELFPFPWFFPDPVRDLIRANLDQTNVSFHLPILRPFVTMELVGELMDLLQLTEVRVAFPPGCFRSILAGLRQEVRSVVVRHGRKIPTCA